MRTSLSPRRGCRCHVCRPERSYDALDQACVDTVRRHGWQVMLVAEDGACADPQHDHDHEPHGDLPAPPFAYTIGLGHHLDHPELLVSGLDGALMHHALNDVAGRVAAGRRLAAGDVLEGVLGGVPVVVEQVADSAVEETVTWSGWFHRAPPSALALVWPTTSGLLPWQPGAPVVLDELQPRRWRVPHTHVGGVAADPGWVLPVAPDAAAFSCTHVVDEGEPILFVAREADVERGEDWTLHCGASGHDTDDLRAVHLAHLVRSAPSVRDLAGLGLDREAWRDSPDEPWTTA